MVTRRNATLLRRNDGKRVSATGSAAAKPMGGKRPFLLEAERDWLLARLDEKPDLTLHALRDELRERGVAVSCDTLWRFLKRQAREKIDFSAMGNEIAKRIEASKAKAALTPKERATNREAVKLLAAKHMESAIKKLSEIVADKNAPASAKVAAVTQLLDRVAGKPKLIDEKETEKSQLERMGEGDLLAYICENISGLSQPARAVIAETIIATERGIHLDYRRMVNNALEAEAESEHAGLSPLDPKPRKEPRR